MFSESSSMLQKAEVVSGLLFTAPQKMCSFESVGFSFPILQIKIFYFFLRWQYLLFLSFMS